MVLTILLLTTSCSQQQPHYVIGVSQCSEDIWREKQNAELRMGAYIHGNVVPSEKKGWCLVTAGGYSIGWGKGDGRVLKNHYPKGLRRLG